MAAVSRPWSVLVAFTVLLGVVAAPPAEADYFTVISEVEVGAFQSAAYWPIGCIDPATPELGGGFDFADLDTMTGTTNGPGSPLAGPPVARVWYVGTSNPNDTPRTIKYAATCGDLPIVAVTEEVFSVPADISGTPEDELASDSSLCPLGTVALSGGVSGDGPVSALMIVSAPTFGMNPLTSSLASRADGENPAPSGWEVQYAAGVNVPFDHWLRVTCADFEDVVTIVESDVVNPGEVETRSASCPSGKVAVGGGVDAAVSTKLRVAANGPLFFGFPLPERLLSQENTVSLDDPGPAPIGWRVAVRNQGSEARAFKVAAICAPEPAAAAPAACAALLALAARRPKRLSR